MSSPARELAGKGWGIYEVALRPDLHQALAALREEAPVFDAGQGVFFVTAWGLADEVARDARLYAGRGVAESMPRPSGLDYAPADLWLMSLDGPAHLRARGLVRREFTAPRVEALLPMVEAVAERRVVAFRDALDAGPADFVKEVALQVPSEVIRQLFAINPGTWEDAVLPLYLASPPPGPERVIEALAHFFHAGRDTPGGLLENLQQPDADGARLSEREAVANAVLLVTAAIDTTTALIANALHCLLAEPGLGMAHGRVDLAPAIVEETLRFEPPALSFSRYAPEALELGGVEIPAGSQLLVSVAGAHRDPARFTDPHRFDLAREPTGLLGFGGGQHFCLGASLARAEARAVLERVLPWLGELALDRPWVWRADNPTVRAPESLWVRRH